MLRSKLDYLYNFNTVFQKSKTPERNGKKHGWLIGGYCWANRLKVDPIRSFLKSVGEYQQIVGIAADEQAIFSSVIPLLFLAAGFVAFKALEAQLVKLSATLGYITISFIIGLVFNVLYSREIHSKNK